MKCYKLINANKKLEQDQEYVEQVCLRLSVAASIKKLVSLKLTATGANTRLAYLSNSVQNDVNIPFVCLYNISYSRTR